MNTTKLYSAIAVLVAVIMAITLYLAYCTVPRVVYQVDRGCLEIYAPVCGVNGITYANACIASREYHVAVAYVGECSTITNLSSEERKYLFWLLLRRQEAGFKSVPVRHVATNESEGESVYTYEWEAERPASIEIVVSNEDVISATDTEGFDYLSVE